MKLMADRLCIILLMVVILHTYHLLLVRASHMSMHLPMIRTEFVLLLKCKIQQIYN